MPSSPEPTVLYGPAFSEGAVLRTVATPDGGVSAERWNPAARRWVKPAPSVADVERARPLRPEELAAWGL